MLIALFGNGVIKSLKGHNATINFMSQGGNGTPVQNDSNFIIPKVMQPTNAKFATTQETIRLMHRLIIGNLSLSGELRARPLTNLRYLKNKGIVTIARTGRHGPPKNRSSEDLFSSNFGHIPGAKGDAPVALLVVVHAAANTNPELTFATKL